MRTERFSFEGRPTFERIAMGMLIVGAVTGALLIPVGAFSLIRLPVTISLVCAAALLGATNLRNDDDTLPLGLRAFAVFSAAVIGYCCQSATVLMVGLGAVMGLALVGFGSNARRAVGVAAGVLGTFWASAVIPQVVKLAKGVPPELVEGTLSGLILGLAMVANHVRVHPDATSARLWSVGGDVGARLQKTWTRCRESLNGAEPKARREVLALLEQSSREAEKLAGQLHTLDTRLISADRKDAEVQLGLLKVDAEAATDATVRAQLGSAAASLSDSLEALDAMQRKRERLGAELRLKLATLERAALALEAAQGEPAELRSLVLRLSQPSAA